MRKGNGNRRLLWSALSVRILWNIVLNVRIAMNAKNANLENI